MGLVRALEPLLLQQTGAAIQARFGAVGAMKEALAAGEACDVMVVTYAMIEALTHSGAMRSGSSATLGRVLTGVAVRAGAAVPAIDSPAALKAALLAADAIYFPDAQRATAGIHFAKVLQALGVHDELQPRFQTFPNGATAMREMAACSAGQPIGCTQVSEIMYSPGVTLAGALPAPFELATGYSAAVSARAANPAAAAVFIALMCGAESQALRDAAGFVA
jgi:molybdate transport system substrate-binding protein